MVEVAVVDEDGAVRGAAVAFPAECIKHAIDRAYPLLRFVDPYGDAVFNHMQMPLVIEDIDRLSRECSGDHAATLTVVRQMCLRVAQGSHLYLKFIGD